MTSEEALAAIRAGQTVTVPYHVEGYGPGRECHSWGDPVEGEAAGPEGWLRVGLDDEGHLIIDEWDEEVCTPALHGADASGAGMVIASL